MRPVIGITSAFHEEEEQFCLSRCYVDAVDRAGGIPVILPPLPPESAIVSLQNINALLLSGGGDLDPVFFGEEALPCTKTISPRRDAYELYLARVALERHIPILGICRGMQVLNVAAGGTVFQDVSFAVRQPLQHTQNAPRWYATHLIDITPDSQLAAIFGVRRLRVNTFHHQAVGRVAPGFTIAARSLDGVIEAVESPAHAFAVGVQFHPEGMWEKAPLFLKLFSALTAASITCDCTKKI
jgi:putative glutamine amidotransferase